MKKLSEITLKDAIEVVKSAYPMFFYKSARWTLIDESKEIGEPCKKLTAKFKIYVFWFFDNSIDINIEDEDFSLAHHQGNFDINYKCYVKAHELGYYVPVLSDLINGKNK